MNAYPHRAAIALGSNLGEPLTILNAALQTLAQTPGIQLDAHSPIYQTVAIGPPQPDYLNACALISTCHDPKTLLSLFLEIEATFGRVRHERWGPRLLDLDLLLFDDLILEEPGLQIPHPRMAERAFVLVPLADVAPNWIEPSSGRSITTLLQQVDCSGVKRLSAED